MEFQLKKLLFKSTYGKSTRKYVCLAVLRIRSHPRAVENIQQAYSHKTKPIVKGNDKVT